MKSFISTKCKVLCSLLLSVVSLFVVIDASAHCKAHHRGLCVVSPPTALCNNATTGTPLPIYQCCELNNRHGRDVWADTWVSGSCSSASPYAMHDFGCKVNSPVFTTGKPIEASCQFSWSTGKFK